MTYTIRAVDRIDWSKAETAVIDQYVWKEFAEYRPITTAQLLWLDRHGLALRMHCSEEKPKATYTHFFDPVYKDSCMEFFFCFQRGGRYINCEMNAIGASLIAVGRSRENRQRITTLVEKPIVKAFSDNTGWFAETFFSIHALRAVFGKATLGPGASLYGNFYKCGDDTAQPHYGMWSPIQVEKPDFHRPEYFGELIIAE